MESAAGKTWDIPLAPVAKPNPTVFVSGITNGYTDVIGGDVDLPIVFHHSGLAEDAEFSIHFDNPNQAFGLSLFIA